VPQHRIAAGAAVGRGITVLPALDDYVANLKRNGRRYRTITSAKTARNRWAPFVEKTAAADLTPEAIDQFIDARRAGGAKPATINAALTVLRAALHLAVERKRLERLPFRIKLRADPAAKRIPA
jgi:integrase-like protein